MTRPTDLSGVLREVTGATREALDSGDGAGRLRVEQTGWVTDVSSGVAHVQGLPNVQSEELVELGSSSLGIALDLGHRTVGVVLLDEATGVEAGTEVRTTGRVTDTPVGEALLGRVVDPAGRPRDRRGTIRTEQRLPIEREAPAILERQPVDTPLQTGIKAIDATIPIGRGQRELVLGDRQTGKTQIAVDTILAQEAGDVVCVYCAIGRRSASVARVIDELEAAEALDRCVLVVAHGDDPPGLRFVAPFAATSIAESFAEDGRDVLVVYDDLTQHARAYRELSLLLRRPPGREAFPGDIFYLHSRLLERATHHVDENGGGSLTALPIVETQAQNISAYIPTNLISITDGQIYLSPSLFEKGHLPAIDVNRSVSRVGGDAQLAAFRDVTSDLKLAYSQFEELERFSRYGTRLDREKRATLEHGRRVRRLLRQPPSDPIPVTEQILTLFAVTTGLLEEIGLDALTDAEHRIRRAAREQLDPSDDLGRRIREGEALDDDDRERLRTIVREALEGLADEDEGKEESPDADAAGTADEDR